MTAIRVRVANEEQVVRQLGTLRDSLQRRIVRRATTAAGKLALKETQRQANTARVTGFLRRSLRSETKSSRGRTTVKIGQEKQKQFKARKTNRVKSKNLSQIQRAGQPVPIHWIERGTQPHLIRAKRARIMAFQVGRRTRRSSGMVFTKFVRHPGMRPTWLLARSQRLSQRPSLAAFRSELETGIRGAV